jgi:high-affinity iron transporter
MRILLLTIPLLASACAGDAGAPASGRELYVRHGCPVCHGGEGRGDGPVAPTLEPPPRDLHDPSTYRVGSSVEEIASTIRTGVLVFQGSGMPAYAHIPEDERLELARYIASLQEGGE